MLLAALDRSMPEPPSVSVLASVSMVTGPAGVVMEMPVQLVFPPRNVLFALVTQFAHGGRLATLTLLPLFVGGAWMLTRVDLERGRRAAAGEAGEAAAPRA